MFIDSAQVWRGTQDLFFAALGGSEDFRGSGIPGEVHIQLLRTPCKRHSHMSLLFASLRTAYLSKALQGNCWAGAQVLQLSLLKLPGGV